MIQFFIKMSAVIAAAYFAVTLPQVGGLSGLVDEALGAAGPGRRSNYLNMLPDFTNNWDLAVAVFIMPIAVQWWAVWYPGAEPGGGSYIAQRMLASKSEKDALGARAVLQRRALRAAARGRGSSSALCLADRLPGAVGHPAGVPATSTRSCIGHDIAYPAMLQVPAGRLHRADGRRPDRGELVDHPHAPQLGRVVPGARFLPPLHQAGRDRERTTCCAGRVATVAAVRLLRRRRSICSTPRKDSFDIILQIGAGTGLLYLVRWFWWRVNAWCEIVAMVSSFAVSVLFLGLPRAGRHGQHARGAADHGRDHDGRAGSRRPTSGRQTDREVLIDFYRKVRPVGPGWTKVREMAGAAGGRPQPSGDNIPMALLGWVAGCTAIWSALFAVGNFLYGRMPQAILLFVVFLIAAVVLVAVLRRGYAEMEP